MDLEGYKRLLLPTTRRDAILKSAKGFFVEVVIGNKTYKVIDGTSQVGTNPFGFRYEPLLKQVREYLSEKGDEPIMIAGNDYYTEYQLELAKKFTNLYPGKPKPGDLKLYYCNSGSEAVERGCLKAAQLYKRGITYISFLNAFHGRTSLALSLNFSKAVHKVGYTSLGRALPVPYATPYESPFGKDPDESCQNILSYMERLIIQEGPENINAVVVEPIQGEGGYVDAHPAFIPGIKKLCVENDIPLIADEVQSALRTGEWFAIQNYKTKPDMISIAKAFSGGAVAFGAALIGNKYATEKQGKQSGTFGGSPFHCFVALKTIEIIEKEKMLENARIQGGYLGKRLNELLEFKFVKCVKGKGLMRGIEIHQRKKPAPRLRNKILKELFKGGVLTEPCGNDLINPTIRFLLPLNITRETIDRICDALHASLKSIRSKNYT